MKIVYIKNAILTNNNPPERHFCLLIKLFATWNGQNIFHDNAFRFEIVIKSKWNEVLLFGKNKRRKGQKERVRDVHLMFRIFLNFQMVCIFGLSTPIVSIKYKDLKLCFRLVATFCIRITLQLNHFIAFLNTDKRRVAFIH